MHNKSHYDTLNVSRNAKPSAITEAYERLVQKCRDELRPNADPSRYLKAIGDAYAVLADPEQRAAYDLWLLEQELGKNGLKQPSAPSMAEPKTTLPDHGARQRSEAIKPSVAISEDVPTADNHSRIAIAAACTLFLAGLIGFFMFKSGPDGSTTPSASDAASPAQPAMNDSAVAAALSPASTEQESSESITEIVIPDHDPVAIEKFTGLWRGSPDQPSRWRKLDIRKKTQNSFVFQLDSKSGADIGEVFGVAEFRNGYALFFNEEYGCSMVFTMKSGALNLDTAGCQAYHGQGAGFDGHYGRPETEASRKTAATDASRPRQVTDRESATPVSANSAPTASQAAPAANPGKLYRFVATVKNAEGKTERIELVAANEEAARAILRDFRGNPTVVRIRRAWF